MKITANAQLDIRMECRTCGAPKVLFVYFHSWVDWTNGLEKIQKSDLPADWNLELKSILTAWNFFP